MDNKLKLAVIGTGFWADFQINAWKEFKEVEIIAVCDNDEDRAQKAAKKHGISNFYTDIDKLIAVESIDFVDIISSVGSHYELVMKSAAAGLNTICQKPMSGNLEECKEMVETCRNKGVKFFIHENFRWQGPIRACKELLQQGAIGKPFRAKVSFCSGFPVFDNQPSLKELERFIIMDLGVHLLDVTRFLFGEMKRVYCQTQKINKGIKGEDVANIMLTADNGLVCFVEISYASNLEKETFPETLLLIEGDTGSIRVDLNHFITLTQKDKGTTKKKVDFPIYNWSDPAYALVHSSIVDCNKSILLDLMNKKPAENTGQDNLKTMELVFLSYNSAETNKVLETSI